MFEALSWGFASGKWRRLRQRANGAALGMHASVTTHITISSSWSLESILMFQAANYLDVPLKSTTYHYRNCSANQFEV